MLGQPAGVVGERSRAQELLVEQPDRGGSLPDAEEVTRKTGLLDDAPANGSAVAPWPVPACHLGRPADGVDVRQLPDAEEGDRAMDEADPEAVLGQRKARLVLPDDVGIQRTRRFRPCAVTMVSGEQHLSDESLFRAFEVHILALGVGRDEGDLREGYPPPRVPLDDLR